MTADARQLSFNFPKADIKSIRFFCLAAAIVVYALFGSPTPNAPGMVEGVVAALLLCAGGVPALYAALKPQQNEILWMSAGRLLLVYGLSVCAVTAVLRGNDGVHILRDVAPFLFFLLPLFLHHVFQKTDQVRWFALLLVFSGFVFSLRSIPEIIAWWMPVAAGDAMELHYFSNAPCVVFAAIMLAGYGFNQFLERFSLTAFLLCFMCAALAVVPLAAMALTLQRGSVAYFALAAALIVAAGFVRSPHKTILFGVIAVMAVMPFLHFITEFINILGHKTVVVGFNARGAEMAAVWNEITASPLTLFFGSGWGGMFESPAVAGIRVNYTHSLLTAMLLKTGVCGLALTFLYLWGLLGSLMNNVKYHPVLVLALAGPILIDVFLYASYKSLDFGLILLLAASLSPVAYQVASKPRVLYSNLYR